MLLGMQHNPQFQPQVGRDRTGCPGEGEAEVVEHLSTLGTALARRSAQSSTQRRMFVPKVVMFSLGAHEASHLR